MKITTKDYVTPTEGLSLESMTSAQLVEFFNGLSEQKVNKFADKKTAIKRINAKLEEVSKTLQDFGGIELVESDDKVLPTEVAVKATAPKPLPTTRIKLDPTLTIKLLVAENPKRKDTAAFDRFAILMDFSGENVGEFLEHGEPRLVGYNNDPRWAAHEIRWCLKKGFIELV